MKTILMMFVLAFGLSFAASAQCGTYVVLSGCVGACGGSYSASYTVTNADVDPYSGVGYFCLAATSNSLCPSENAYASLQRNTNRAKYGYLNQGDVLGTKAFVGDVLTVNVNLTAGDPNVNCIWQGETHFALTR